MQELPVQNVIDALSAHIAIIDEQGEIIAVNDAWRRFARENGAEDSTVSIGVNYLEVCEHSSQLHSDRLAAFVASGIRAVLSGVSPSFSLEYPCHSDTENRWFSMEVRPLGLTPTRVLLAHENITEEKKSVKAALKESQQLLKLITEREIHAFQHRIQNLLKSRKFPQPGPGGPNYPWPPV